MSKAPASDEWILGLGGSSHDFSAALMRGTEIIVAIEAERVTRVKYRRPLWYQDPARACVDYCLDTVGISRAELSRVFSCELLPYRARAGFEGVPVEVFSHHRAHAASACMLLGSAERAVVIVADGMGSPLPLDQPANSGLAQRETFSFFSFGNSKLEEIGGTRGTGYLEYVDLTTGATNSVGLLYEMVTALLGFHPLESGKTMGLAAWGKPRFLGTLMKFVTLGKTVNDVFSLDPFDGRFQTTIQDILDRERHSFTVRADLAASVQELFTQTLLRCYELVEDMDFDVLCLAGGCALNSVANGVLAGQLSGKRRLVVPPHASDAGIALGALWLGAERLYGGPMPLSLDGKPLWPAIARPGRRYSVEDRRSAAGVYYQKAALDSRITSPADLAQFIADDHIIAIFNGSSEIGPRALGGRSVLADPRKPAVRERINREIKHREPFRPLAPVILTEHFDEYFSPTAAKNYFMLVVAKANERCRREAPAVVHVDGSARVQIVDDTSDPFLAQVIREFKSITGIPILLNTSFNRRGEPIVESPRDAMEAFIDMELDGLYLDGDFYFRPQSPATTSSDNQAK